MAGDDRKRHCRDCKRDVHNLSAMTDAEVAAFLEAAAALPENVHAPCVSLFQRADGTVLTADCPIGLSRRRRRAILASTLQVGAVAIVAVSALATMVMHQSATTKLEDESPRLEHVSTVTVPNVVVDTRTPYYGVVQPPSPSLDRDRPEGVHMAGGMRAMPPPVKPPPPPRRQLTRVATKSENAF
jgi:hypothetical protein